MKYTPEMREFIKNNVKGRSSAELAEMFSKEFNVPCTKSMMKSYKSNHKLKSGPCKKLYSKVFPKEICHFIYANYKGTGYAAMADKLNKKFNTNYKKSQIRSFYRNNKLNCGLTGCFKKGNIPPNKGKKGYCSPGSEKGWFKKGQIPVNVKAVGSERINVYGYIEIKIKEPNIWKLKHQLIWEKERGKIPKECVVTFLDGNPLNCVLDNLTIITKAENLIMNQKNLRSHCKETTETGILIAKLHSTIYKKEKVLKTEKNSGTYSAREGS